MPCSHTNIARPHGVIATMSVVAILLSLHCLPVRAQRSDQRIVKQNAEAFYTALHQKDYRRLVTYFNAASIARFESIRTLALSADSAKVASLPIIEQMVVLSVRAHREPEKIRGGDLSDIVAAAAEGLNQLAGMGRKVEFYDINVDEYGAFARMRVDGQETGYCLYMVLEGGDWKVEFVRLLELSTGLIRFGQLASGLLTAQLVEDVVAASPVARDPKSLWHPPFPNTSLSSAPQLNLLAANNIKWAALTFQEIPPYGWTGTWNTALTYSPRLYASSVAVHPEVYFDRGASHFSERYRFISDAKMVSSYVFREPAIHPFLLKGRARKVQSEVLDVIGKRLSERDDVWITLEGRYSAESGESALLAAERVASVRGYLTSIWNIDPGRIDTIEPRRLVSPDDHAMAQWESRSVRIYDGGKLRLDSIPTVMREAPGFEMIALQMDVLPPTGELFRKIDLVAMIGADTVARSTVPTGWVKPTGVYGLKAFWTIPRNLRHLEGEVGFFVETDLQNGDQSASEVVRVPIHLADPDDDSYYGDFDLWGPFELGGGASDTKGFASWLDGKKSSEPIEVTLRKFAFRDSTLAPDHRSEIEGVYSRMREVMRDDPTRRWRMRVYGYAEPIESTDLANADIDRLLSRVFDLEAIAEGERPTTTVQTRFFFLPSGQRVWTQASWYLDDDAAVVTLGSWSAGIGTFGYNRVSDELMKSLPDSVAFFLREIEAESVAMARARNVAHLVDEQLATISIDSISVSTGSPLKPVRLVPPEYHFDSREVRLIFYDNRSYLWYLDERS